MKAKTVLKQLAELLAEEQAANGKRKASRKSSNPRTKKQMGGRTAMANLVALYRNLAPVIRETYPGRIEKHTPYNAFVKANLSLNRVHFTKEQAEFKACVAAPCNLSQGTLTPIEIRKQENALVTSLCLPAGFELTEHTTAGRLSAALMYADSDWEADDELVVVHLVQKYNTVAHKRTPRVRANVYRLAFDSESKVPVYTLIPPALLRVTADGYIGTSPDLEAGGVAYIRLRRTVTGKTFVSAQNVVLTPGNDVYAAYTGSEAAGEAAASYGSAREVSIYEAAGNRAEVPTAPASPVLVRKPENKAEPEPEVPREPSEGAGIWFSEPSVTQNVRVVYCVTPRKR